MNIRHETIYISDCRNTTMRGFRLSHFQVPCRGCNGVAVQNCRTVADMKDTMSAESIPRPYHLYINTQAKPKSSRSWKHPTAHSKIPGSHL